MRFALFFVLSAACGPAPAATHAPPPVAVARSPEPPTVVALCRNARECRTQCDRAHGPSCTRLGRMLLFADGAARDLAGARDALGRACAANDGDGCAWLARRMAATGSPAADVLATAARGCDHGSGLACMTLASWTRHGYGATADAAKADALEARADGLLEAACTAGDDAACERRAQLVEPHDRARAALLYGEANATTAKRCAENDVLACSSAAASVHLANPFQAPSGEALTVMRHACDLDAGLVCAALALHDEAAKPKACSLGFADACDAERAATLNASACADGEGDACVKLKRIDRARTLFTATCVFDDGCWQAARMAEHGEGGPADFAEAVRMLEVPCASGSCGSLARLLLRGDAAQRARGVSLLETECATSTDACFDAAAALPKTDRRARDLVERGNRTLEAKCAKDDCGACLDLAKHVESKRAAALQKKACATGCGFACPVR
ncbi:MAG TPA: hypothetical protein VGH28_13160 [Polyangiaceae bacterium]